MAAVGDAAVVEPAPAAVVGTAAEPEPVAAGTGAVAVAKRTPEEKKLR